MVLSLLPLGFLLAGSWRWELDPDTAVSDVDLFADKPNSGLRGYFNVVEHVIIVQLAFFYLHYRILSLF